MDCAILRGGEERPARRGEAPHRAGDLAGPRFATVAQPIGGQQAVAAGEDEVAGKHQGVDAFAIGLPGNVSLPVEGQEHPLAGQHQATVFSGGELQTVCAAQGQQDLPIETRDRAALGGTGHQFSSDDCRQRSAPCGLARLADRLTGR